MNVGSDSQTTRREGKGPKLVFSIDTTFFWWFLVADVEPPDDPKPRNKRSEYAFAKVLPATCQCVVVSTLDCQSTGFSQ